MSCQCGSCSGGSRGSRDAGFADLSVTVQDDGRAADGVQVCAGPMDRLERAADRATSGDLGGAADMLSAGDFSAPRCWPLWTWLAALLVLAWWRS